MMTFVVVDDPDCKSAYTRKTLTAVTVRARTCRIATYRERAPSWPPPRRPLDDLIRAYEPAWRAHQASTGLLRSHPVL